MNQALQSKKNKNFKQIALPIIREDVRDSTVEEKYQQVVASSSQSTRSSLFNTSMNVESQSCGD